MADSERKTFPATVEGLKEATTYLRAYLETRNAEARVRSQLLVCLDEIASNIVNYSGASEFTIELWPIENPSRLKLIFFDAGTPYDPLKHEDPDVTLSAQERDIGGLGLLMVKKMMDEVSYENVDGRNVLTLVKNF